MLSQIFDLFWPNRISAFSIIAHFLSKKCIWHSMFAKYETKLFSWTYSDHPCTYMIKYELKPNTHTANLTGIEQDTYLMHWVHLPRMNLLWVSARIAGCTHPVYGYQHAQTLCSNRLCTSPRLREAKEFLGLSNL